MSKQSNRIIALLAVLLVSLAAVLLVMNTSHAAPAAQPPAYIQPGPQSAMIPRLDALRRSFLPANDNWQIANAPNTAYTLTIWSYTNISAVQSIVDDFQTAYPTVTVNLVVTTAATTVAETFPVAVHAGAGPDLLWQAPSDQVILFASQGLINSVDNHFSLTQFLTDTVTGVFWQGSHWGVPETDGNELMLLYNKALLSTPPTNTTDMISAAQTFSGTGVYGLVYNLNEPFWLIPWLTGFNGSTLDLNSNPVTPTLNTTAMISALKFVQDLKFVHQIVPASCDYTCADDAFKLGNAAMLINGDWSLNNYANLSPTVQLGIARIPLVTATGLWPEPYTSGKYFVFNSHVSNQQFQLSQLFVRFATTKVEQVYWAQNNLLPATVAAFQDPIVQGNPLLQASANQILVGQPMPAVPEMRCAWDAMFTPLANVMDIGAPPGLAATEMQASAGACVKDLQTKFVLLPLLRK